MIIQIANSTALAKFTTSDYKRLYTYDQQYIQYDSYIIINNTFNAISSL